MPKITVIIFGEGTKVYLERCIQSLEHQTFQDFEILLAGGGIPKTDRIHLIHPRHSGSSATKNAALDWSFSESNSEWICFVDSVDTVHPQYLQGVLDAAETNDACISACGLAPAKESVLKDDGNCSVSIWKTSEYYLNDVSKADTLKGKLFKKDCFHNVRFPEEKTHEDDYIVYRLLFQYERIPVIEQSLYVCAHNSQGITAVDWTPDDWDKLEAVENQLSFFVCKQYNNIAKNKIHSLIRDNLAFQEQVLKCDELTSGEKSRHVSLCKKQLRRILIQYKKYNWLSYSKSNWAKCVYANAFAGIWIGREMWGGLKRVLASTPANRLLAHGVGDAMAEREMHLYVRRYRKYITKTKAVLLQTPVHGNLGDHAIAQAEMEMLQKLGIPFAEFPWTKGIEEQCAKVTPRQETILLQGGGFMGQLWPAEEKRIRDSIQAFCNNRIIIMPQTIYFDMNTEEGRKCFQESKAVYDSHPDLTVFLREASSYRFMRMYMPEIHVELVPDMALMLGWNPLNLERQNVLICMRKDKEKTVSAVESERVLSILSNIYEKKIMTDTVIPGEIELSKRSQALEEKFREFSAASLVITDRLHGMIFAAITETPCIVLDSLSHKIRGCYEWIRDLDYIQFADNINDLPGLIEKLKTVKPKYNRKRIEEAMKPLQEVLIEATK